MQKNGNKENQYNYFGSNAKLEHIGFVIKSIEKNYPDAAIYTDPIQKVKVAFIVINGIKIEIVEPLEDCSPVNGYLNKGQNIYHLCFSVPDINESIIIARKYGFHCIAKPVEAVAFNNKKIAWLYNKNFGLFELVES